jgi:hypothetical protein
MKVQSKFWQGLAISSAMLFFSACSELEEAKAEVKAALAKSEAGAETSECENYKEQFMNTLEAEWKSLWEKNCTDDFVKNNTPADWTPDCKVKYSAMLLEGDSIITAKAKICAGNAAQDDPNCKDAASVVEDKARSVMDECGQGGEEIYFPEFNDHGFDQTEDGKCVWDAWVPEETREAGQDSTAKLLCLDKPPKCEEKTINQRLQKVEIHKTPAGKEIYLPCLEQFKYGTHPCDTDEDGVVSKFELDVTECKELKGNPCDFNQDGEVDDYEKEECTFANEKGFIDAKNYDPCDFNFDGRVDQFETETCQQTSACQSGEVPFWNSKTKQDICVKDDELPRCNHPTWPELINGKVACVDPCDQNMDGNVDKKETKACEFKAKVCEKDEIPFFDPERREDICVQSSDVPKCKLGDWPELIKGIAKCIDPCDQDRSGKVDAWEKGNCRGPACEMDELPLWNTEENKDVCIKKGNLSECQHPNWLAIVKGKPACIDQCDWNTDGKVDDYESSNCESLDPVLTDDPMLPKDSMM